MTVKLVAKSQIKQKRFESRLELEDCKIRAFESFENCLRGFQKADVHTHITQK